MVQYSDESTPRTIYKYRDYTTVLDVRRSGNDVYILRGITLVLSERRLSHYDVSSRTVIADRRIDPKDLE
jgi:hypothetical protein